MADRLEQSERDWKERERAVTAAAAEQRQIQQQAEAAAAAVATEQRQRQQQAASPTAYHWAFEGPTSARGAEWHYRALLNSYQMVLSLQLNRSCRSVSSGWIWTRRRVSHCLVPTSYQMHLTRAQCSTAPGSFNSPGGIAQCHSKLRFQ